MQPSAVPENIRKRREKFGWSQEELGRRLGVSGRTVHRWESGEARPNIETVEAVAHQLWCSSSELATHGWDGGKLPHASYEGARDAG